MRRIYIIMILCLWGLTAVAQQQGFTIADKGKVSPIIVDSRDWKGVSRAANDLADDIRKVTGTKAEVTMGQIRKGSIIAGTIGKSRLIDGLIARKKIDVSKIRGQWESYLIDLVDDNLVIAGSDKRGTIYGIYEISKQIGVSPWYGCAAFKGRKQETID